MSVFRPIAGLYLPAVERHICAYDIAKAFYRANILMPNVVSIEKNGGYNRVYIGIEYWHDTEVAYNFIARLHNSSLETRFIYDNAEELWWVVEVNKFSHKLVSAGNQKRKITTFKPWVFDDHYFEGHLLDQDEEEACEPAPLQRQSAAWSTEDMEGCLEVLGEPLTFANEDMYFMCRNQRNAWVDQLLEKMESDKRYRYEEPSFEDDREPFFEEEDYPEDDEEEKFRAFQQEADDWYEEMAEEREHAKHKLSPKEFKKWEASYEKNMTERQKNFELYLKTNFPIY